MNKTIQIVMLIVGLILVVYGIYRLVTPEASIDIGIAKFEAQDNDTAYVAIGIGLAALVLSFIVGKKGN